MALNIDLLKSIMNMQEKEAYNPPTPMAPGMPPAAPGMDPSMMGGAPGMPIDPSALGLPPAGAPAQAPVGTPVTLDMEDLQAILAQAAGGSAGGTEQPSSDSGSGHTTNGELADRIDELEGLVTQLMGAMGLNVNESSVPVPGGVNPGQPQDLTPPPAVPESLGASAMPPPASAQGDIGSLFTPDAQKVASKDNTLSDVLSKLRIYGE